MMETDEFVEQANAELDRIIAEVRRVADESMVRVREAREILRQYPAYHEENDGRS